MVYRSKPLNFKKHLHEEVHILLLETEEIFEKYCKLEVPLVVKVFAQIGASDVSIHLPPYFSTPVPNLVIPSIPLTFPWSRSLMGGL